MKKVRRVVRVEMTHSAEITCIVTRSDREKWRIFLTDSQSVSIFFIVTTEAHLSFFIPSSLCKIRVTTEPESNWSGCYNAGDNTHHSSVQPPGAGTGQSGECWCLAGVHLSVVLTFELSWCYWQMSNVVGCLEISYYQAICQNVGIQTFKL